MRIGVIIVFHNSEKHIDVDFFVNYLDKAKNLEFCLVNNASKDNTYKVLKEIKISATTSVALVDIKKFKSDISAVRSGARFMFNQFDLDHIGFISTNLINTKKYSINSLIYTMSKHQDAILKYDKNEIEKKHIRQTLFQKVFSIIEYLEIIKYGANPNNLIPELKR